MSYLHMNYSDGCPPPIQKQQILLLYPTYSRMFLTSSCPTATPAYLQLR